MGRWLDVIEAGEKTAGDFDKLGVSAAAALNKLEADALGAERVRATTTADPCGMTKQKSKSNRQRRQHGSSSLVEG